MFNRENEKSITGSRQGAFSGEVEGAFDKEGLLRIHACESGVTQSSCTPLHSKQLPPPIAK